MHDAPEGSAAERDAKRDCAAEFGTKIVEEEEFEF